MQQPVARHQPHQQGFAIGPILLAIALMAIVTAFMSISISNSSNINENERVRSMASILTSQADDIKQAYDDTRELGYDQNEVLLATSGCLSTEFCLFAPETGAMPKPTLPSTAFTQTSDWQLTQKTSFTVNGNNICDSSEGAWCEFLIIRYVTKDVCLMINHLLHNKPFKEVTTADTTNVWSNPMVSPQDIVTSASFSITGTDYQYVSTGCVARAGPEYVFFTFLDP